MINMSSALPNNAVRYPTGGTASMQAVDGSGDGSGSIATGPPPAGGVGGPTPRVAGLYSEYDASTHVETLSMPGSPVIKDEGAYTAVGSAYMAAATHWVDAEEATEEYGGLDDLYGNVPADSDPYEMLLMAGAGVPLESFAETGGIGLRQRASADVYREYPDGRHLTRLGAKRSSDITTNEPSIDELYDKAMQEGGAEVGYVYLGENATVTPLEKTNAPVVPSPTEEEGQHFDPLTVKQILAFALPALGAVLADPLMSLVDTACVGQMSSVGLAALGPNTTIFGFVAMMFSFFTTATVSMCARAYARGETKEMGKVVSDGILLAVICGVVSATALLTGSTSILQVLNTGSEIIGPAAEYLYWRALALPFTLISMVGAACCLGQRDSATPLRVAGISGLVNLVVDLYLVMGPPQMGIAGAAIATAGSQVLAAVLYLMTISKRVDIKFRMPYWSRVKPFVTAGVVLTLRSCCIMTSISMMTAQSAALGTVSIAAHQVVVGLLTLAQFCPEPISQAAQTFLATTAGALRKGTCTPAEKKYAKEAGRLLMGVGTVFGLMLAMGSTFIATHMPHIFTSDPVVMGVVVSVAPQLGMAVLLYSFVCCLDGLVFASGDMLYAAGSQVVNLAAMVGFLAMFGGSGLGGIWMSFVALCGLRLVQNTARVVHQYI